MYDLTTTRFGYPGAATEPSSSYLRFSPGRPKRHRSVDYDFILAKLSYSLHQSLRLGLKVV